MAELEKQFKGDVLQGMQGGAEFNKKNVKVDL